MPLRAKQPLVFQLMQRKGFGLPKNDVIPVWQSIAKITGKTTTSKGIHADHDSNGKRWSEAYCRDIY